MKMIIANWKMSLDVKKALALGNAFRQIKSAHKVAVCPSPVHLSMLREVAPNMTLGGQDCAAFGLGAHTGGVAASQLKELGAKYCLVGHSERRAAGDTVELVQRKFEQAVQAGLVPVLCIGETQEEKAAGKTMAVLEAQLASISAAPSELILAYEPVWAIGTGLTAEPSEVNAIHQDIQAQVKDKLDLSAKILYGGSVKPDNAAKLLAQASVDGLLVGGASLDAEQFTAICES